MRAEPRPKARALRRVAAALAAAALIAAALDFPGRMLFYAFAIGTGVGLGPVQARVDALENKAVARGEFSADDKAFLRDLYRTLAKGAALTGALGESSRLMDRYLDRSGAPLALDPQIFTRNARVRARMDGLAAQARSRLSASAPECALSTESFYMPDPSAPDSVYGLYYGTLSLRARRLPSGALALRWRAEVPWTWPSYESLAAKYGDPHAENFPIPNLLVLLRGRRAALRLDNGLGEQLTRLALAASFTAYAEWDETRPAR